VTEAVYSLYLLLLTTNLTGHKLKLKGHTRSRYTQPNGNGDNGKQTNAM